MSYSVNYHLYRYMVGPTLFMYDSHMISMKSIRFTSGISGYTYLIA